MNEADEDLKETIKPLLWRYGQLKLGPLGEIYLKHKSARIGAHKLTQPEQSLVYNCEAHRINLGKYLPLIIKQKESDNFSKAAQILVKWKLVLSRNNEFLLPGLGKLFLKKGKVQIQREDQFASNTFGLASVTLPTKKALSPALKSAGLSAWFYAMWVLAFALLTVGLAYYFRHSIYLLFSALG